MPGVKHYQFLDMVKNTWSCPATGSPLSAFARNLKLLREKLRAWNKETFSNIHQNVRYADVYHCFLSSGARVGILRERNGDELLY